LYYVLGLLLSHKADSHLPSLGEWKAESTYRHYMQAAARVESCVQKLSAARVRSGDLSRRSPQSAVQPTIDRPLRNDQSEWM